MGTSLATTRPDEMSESSVALACAAPAVTAALLVMPLATGLYDALGFAVAPLPAVPSLLLATTIAPMLAGLPASMGKRGPAAVGIVALVASIVALLAPKFTTALPQRANVVFRQDEGSARVFVDTTWGPSTWGTAPSSMLQAIGGPLQTASALPWTAPSRFADAPPLDLEAPVAEVLSVEEDAGRRRVRARLRSRRGAPTLALVLPHGRRVEVKVEGRWASPRPVANGSMVGIFALPAEGVVVELDSPGTEPIPLTLLDRSSGVPAGTKADDAVQARPREATPFQDGDVTVVSRALSL